MTNNQPKTPAARIRKLEAELASTRRSRDLWRERYWQMKEQRDYLADEKRAGEPSEPGLMQWTGWTASSR